MAGCPRARHGFDAAANMARLKAMADEAGRDAAELSVNVFGAPADAAVLARLCRGRHNPGPVDPAIGAP